MAGAGTIEPDLVLAWEMVDSDMTLPYWIHRAGHSDWNGSRILRHTHRGFAEVFWVESGHAMHEVNRVEHSIDAGHLMNGRSYQPSAADVRVGFASTTSSSKR